MSGMEASGMIKSGRDRQFARKGDEGVRVTVLPGGVKRAMDSAMPGV